MNFVLNSEVVTRRRGDMTMQAERHIKVICKVEGPVVHIGSVMLQSDGKVCDRADKVIHPLPWECIEDVELLSTIFAEERVDVFKEVVRLLGKASRSQDAILTLLED